MPAAIRPIDEAAVERMAESIGALGLQHPISVRLAEAGKYVLVAGQHRLAACKRLGFESIDCIVLECDDVTARLWTLAENLERR